MPYTIICKDPLGIVGTVSGAGLAAQIEMVYYKDQATIVVNPMEVKTFSQLSELELKLLLNNLQIPTDGCDYPTLISYLKYYCENLPVNDPNQQALDYIQGIMRNEILKPPAAPPDEPVEKKSKPPKAEGSAPSPKGATGRVWEIAEGVLTTVGSGDIKALRKAVIEACATAGIHEATAATQWSKWKKSKGL